MSMRFWKESPDNDSRTGRVARKTPSALPLGFKLRFCRALRAAARTWRGTSQVQAAADASAYTAASLAVSGPASRR